MSKTFVARTCTRLAANESAGPAEVEAAPLSAFGSESAYVLLGDAGAGKSTEFRKEREVLGDAAVLCSARDFVALDVKPEWSDKTLFIDGLDEIRAGTADGRSALDEIRRRLDRLNWPRYRISCREADWLGNNDRSSLESATPGESVAVLRLDPLSDRAKEALVGAHIDVGDVSAFLAEAERRRLSGMLDNPLTLEMLASAVARGGGSWPASRREIFEFACKRMVREHNDEHIAAAGFAPPVETLLTAAGELGALQLLAGLDGFSLGPTGGTSPYIALDSLQPLDARISNDETRFRRFVLGTKLFSAAHDTEDVAGWPRMAPLHRHIAEFLGGRYLARQVENGLPARRAVALMVSPHDGRVVTSLRGLSAWFAAHCAEALDRLIDADPVGIGLYGDVEGLNGEQKRRLLRALAAYAAEGPLLRHEWRDGRSTGYQDTTAWAFRSIIDAETITAVADLLGARPNDPTGERVREFLLEVLSVVEDGQFGSARIVLPQVVAMVRDDGHSPDVRLAALDAFIHLAPDGADTKADLRRLLDDIAGGRVRDPDHELCGTLLSELYPDTIGPADVWQFAELGDRATSFRRFDNFWHKRLAATCLAEGTGALLDAPNKNATRVVPALRAAYLDSTPVDLLAAALGESGDQVEQERLFAWLNVAGACEPEKLPATSDAAQSVRRWLEARPKVQKHVFVEWLRHRDAQSPLGFEAYSNCLALHGSKLPADFGRWCLEQAVEVFPAEPELARELIRNAHMMLDDASRNEGLSAEFMNELTRGSDALAQQVDSLLKPAPPDPEVARMVEDHRQRERERNAERQRRANDWAIGLRAGLIELRENTFAAANLHWLAMAFLGQFAYSDDAMNDTDRLGEFIGGDPELVESVLQAFRGSIEREDTPSVDETVALKPESKHSWLALPMLAGLRLRDREDPVSLDGLDDELKRKALAIWYCVRLDLTSTPSWHDRWLVQDPDLVVDVMYRCAVGAIRAGDQYPPALNELDAIVGHDSLRHSVRLRLLEALPVRGANAQLRLLDRLLLDVMAYPESTGLREIVDAKLSASSMTVAQKARWLMAASLSFEGEFLHALAAFADGHESGVRHVAEFLHSDLGPRMSGQPRLTAELNSTTLATLIEVLGRAYRPRKRNGFITVEIDASERVESMISQLSQTPDSEASEALRHLEIRPDLETWHDSLRRAREDQSRIRRDADYSHPSVEAVQCTLGGGLPANAADLSALLIDRLDDLAHAMRGDSSDPWRPYWNEDSYGRPITPKPENSCRDSLVAALRERLPPEVEPAREGSYAADKRADIRVSSAGFNVPIEIKRQSHSDLWHAMCNQLMGQYTTDPATDGFGIYLVLWFGDEKMPTPPSGQRPRSPDELREMLEVSLSVDEARKISVCVIDVTRPGN